MGSTNLREINRKENINTLLHIRVSRIIGFLEPSKTVLKPGMQFQFFKKPVHIRFTLPLIGSWICTLVRRADVIVRLESLATLAKFIRKAKKVYWTVVVVLV